MAASTFNAQEIEIRRKLLREELDILEAEKIKNLGSMKVIDYHHPERSPGWPPYRHQAFPTMLYHPTAKDEAIEATRLGVRRRNDANPNFAPMDVPCSQARTIKVGNKEEKAAALASGFVETPILYNGPAIDSGSPLEMIGRAAANPLVIEDQPRQLSVETIIKLNQMPKDELVKHAMDAYGVECADEASKVDIINAISQGGTRAANAA